MAALMEGDMTNALLKNPLSNFCKDISLSRFKNHSVSESLGVGSLRDNKDESEISQWLSLIFVSSPSESTLYHSYTALSATGSVMNHPLLPPYS